MANTPLNEIFPSVYLPTEITDTLATSFGSPVEEIPQASSSNTYSATDMVSERLYNILPRSAAAGFTEGGQSTYTTDRGPIASMRILSSNRDVSLSGRSGLEISVDKELGTLLDDASGYKNFFLTDVAVQYSEKTQITTTFGDSEVVYYFGRQPIMFNISGLLVDAIYADWFTKFITLYQSTLRGTQSAKYFELIEITLPNMKLIGSITSLGHQQNAGRDSEVYFNMQFLAKEAIPIAIPEISGNSSNILGELIDFSVGKGGVGEEGYSLSSGVGSGINVGNFNLASIFSDIKSSGEDFSKTLNSFRSSIFSPIYGVIASITKIIKTANKDIQGIISSFTSPVNAILRDVTYVATQAIAIANLIEFNVNEIISIPDRVTINARNTLQSLKSSAGVISRMPESLSQVFKRHFRGGRLKSQAAILSSGKGGRKSKSAVLSSGAPYSPTNAYKI